MPGPSLLNHFIVTLSLLSSATSFSPSSVQRRSTKLFIKLNERAHLDKKLEDLMDNDWREFRARLVAIEQAEATEQTEKGKEAEDGDEKLAKQAHLSDMFADALSSFFSSKDAKRKDLLDGEDVGNYIPDKLMTQDPFVSRAELPIFMKPKAKIDKHRWAHAIPHVEPGCVLVASEHLGGVFHQTVVLIVDHSESQGTIGMVINRPLEGDLKSVASRVPTNLDLSLKLAFCGSQATYGGPVGVEDFSILHGYGEVEGARKLATGIFVGGSEQLMNQVRMGKLEQSSVLFVKGHASWTGGQLNRELSKKVWYPASVSRDLILRYAGAPTTEEDNLGDLWSDILTCMGGDYAKIPTTHAGKGDRRMMP
mmetsp:Transcript_11387/g.19312  ORF Transcript_11387/g.19312 Transcript_11387/m.19312 type:complete len:366 (-) Transcript_11387:111-1208(-)